MPEEGEVFDVELEEDLLEANRRIAEENKQILERYRVKAIDVMGSVGSGKTMLIERLIELLGSRYRIAVFGGDVTTTIDAERVRRRGAKTLQINTGKECHLDANLVRKALSKIDLNDVDVLFIENVGNLICPAEFPLGTDSRVVVISVTEGPYTPLKHPYIFMESDVAVINKIDLADAMGVDVGELEARIKKISPDTTVVRTSCKTGEGIDRVARALGLL
ncbi:MAG: hydrogenase accessory protein HypB [Candidatus Terraquivivens tikiterensis]|uniref:Hydrogenase accessory protein HypB n=1 Tax=Candidatus Terraquivivens tikiterensis TaxID=1980982 RepID=A0A2R7Y400_9ARCH|nr:MAG: hydrogenase accessory protein HypB [Candidatus Terraquivivens tikiterensis]